jgi:hypothetical protein
MTSISTPNLTLETTLKRRAEQPEWWTAQSIPWYHYIPLKYDYTDLWDVLAFLDGAPDTTGSLGSSGSSLEEEEEEEQEEEEKGEKRARKETRGVELAEEVAKRGMELAKENLRCVVGFGSSVSIDRYWWGKKSKLTYDEDDRA